MTGRRCMAVAAALLAALATAGCGLGPGPGVGSVELTVTREYGSVPVLSRSLPARESDTVMRLLERSADVSTRYGGGYVRSIDGTAEAERGGHPYDWFFYVDGIEAPIGAADYQVKGGERVWWDYRDWSATEHVPAVVGQWPAPFADGIGGKRYPVAVECLGPRHAALSPHKSGKEPHGAWLGACRATRRALRREGAKLTGDAAGHAIRVLVGPWRRLRSDPVARQIEAGPAESGVFADFRPGAYELVALDQGGGEARRLGPGAGLVAATSRYGGLPVWVVTGGTPAAVRAAAGALDAARLRDHYAVAIEDGKEIPLPLEEP